MLQKKSRLFVLPAFAIYTFLMIIPILGAFAISLTNWNGISPSFRFTGLKNYVDMLSDTRLHNAIGVTLRITITVCLSVNILGLFIACLLSETKRMTSFMRSVFFMPYVISTVAISFIWLSILSYTGAFNSILKLIGLGNYADNYIGTKDAAIQSICIIEIWRTMGFHMVLYLTAIQTVPEELYEAATIDGANGWQKFWYVTLPTIVPGITISVIMSVMVEMKQYDIVKVITNGGPGYSTETITYNIVTQAFGNNMLGYSSSIAVFLFAVIAVISVMQLKLASKVGDKA